MSKPSLLTALSECRPGMLTAPGNGGSATRWTTTSIVFVVPLKVPADRMMMVLLASVVGEVSIAGLVVPLNPVSGVSVTPLSLRMETLNVPPLAAAQIATFVSPASATHGWPVVAPASRPLQLWLPSAVLTSTADGSQSWSGLLAGATTGQPWVALAGLTNVAIWAAANGGTFSVSIRNDNGVTDTPLTGLSGTTNPAMDTSPTADANKTVIMRSAGTFNGTTKTIEVVVQRVALPPFPGAVNIPGRHSDSAVSSDGFDIDGRDYACTASGTGCDAAANWTVTANPLKYGMATQPGIQAGGGTTRSEEHTSELQSRRDLVC